MSTAANAVRTQLIESNLDLSLRTNALKYFAYSWNRVSPKLMTNSSFELNGETKLSVRHGHSFDSLPMLAFQAKSVLNYNLRLNVDI